MIVYVRTECWQQFPVKNGSHQYFLLTRGKSKLYFSNKLTNLKMKLTESAAMVTRSFWNQNYANTKLILVATNDEQNCYVPTRMWTYLIEQSVLFLFFFPFT